MSRSRRLLTVLVLNLSLVAALVIVGLTAHSLGVLAAGADYLADAAAIAMSLLAIAISKRRGAGGRATTVAAGVNGGWLLILCMAVIVGAIVRLVGTPPEVEGVPVLLVSAIAALVMVGGVVVLGGDLDDYDEGGALNMRAVLLDTVADAGAAAGVALTGAVIAVTHGWYWLDPAVALAIAVVIGYHAVVLLRDVARTLSARRPSS